MANERSATAQEVGLDRILEKYKPVTGAQSSGTRVQRTLQQRTAAPTRISSSPRVYTEASQGTGDIYKEMAAINLTLAELAEEYGELNVSFKNTLGRERFLRLGDVGRIAYYSLPVVGDKNRVRKVKIDAAGRHGNSIAFMVDRMANVLGQQYEAAKNGRKTAEGVKVDVVAHLKKLDRSLIERLTSSYTGSADLAAAEDDVKRLATAQDELTNLLGRYETDIQKAKAVGDVGLVGKLTEEALLIVDKKAGLYDGKLAAEGQVSELMRDMLESAEGVQSAKGAIAASRANYKAVNAWIDAMNELVFKYKHAKEDFIPVFQVQGKIAAGGMQALGLKKTLLEVAGISQRLMEANANLMERLTNEVFDLVKTPLYDVEQARACEARIDHYMEELNQQKKEWAEMQQRFSDLPDAAHYAEHR